MKNRLEETRNLISKTRHALNEAPDQIRPEIQELVKSIAQATDHNAHTDAVRTLARYCVKERHCNPNVLRLIDAIETIHDIEGSIPREIDQYRSSIRATLTSKLKPHVSTKEIQAISGAF